VAAVIRHTVSEGWLLVRSRMVVTAVLAVALAVPLCLAGVTTAIGLWLQPLTGSAAEAPVVAVLLHPQLTAEQRGEWLVEQRRTHPQWQLRAIPPELMVERLRQWFPYLEELLSGDHGGGLVPPLVEITTSDPSTVNVLADDTAVVAIGPRSSVHRVITEVARDAGWILAGLTAVLLVTAAALAAIWVHLEIYRHGDEITIMRLVGATELAVRGPFLFAVSVPGVVSAAVATTGTVAVVGMCSGLTTALGLPPVNLGWWVVVCQLVVGCSLPAAAGALTLARHAFTDFES
jgi:cell division transport system permease protein